MRNPFAPMKGDGSHPVHGQQAFSRTTVRPLGTSPCSISRRLVQRNGRSRFDRRKDPTRARPSRRRPTPKSVHRGSQARLCPRGRRYKFKDGAPGRIRISVSGLNGRRPWPLDDGGQNSIAGTWEKGRKNAIRPKWQPLAGSGSVALMMSAGFRRLTLLHFVTAVSSRSACAHAWTFVRPMLCALG